MTLSVAGLRQIAIKGARDARFVSFAGLRQHNWSTMPFAYDEPRYRQECAKWSTLNEELGPWRSSRSWPEPSPSSLS